VLLLALLWHVFLSRDFLAQIDSAARDPENLNEIVLSEFEKSAEIDPTVLGLLFRVMDVWFGLSGFIRVRSSSRVGLILKTTETVL